MVRKGFSLAEALVVMGIVSILFAVTTKVITTSSQNNRTINIPHGYFICTTDGNSTVKYQYSNNGIIENNETGKNECIFTPPTSAQFFNVYAIQKMSCYYSIETTIDNTLKIKLPQKTDENDRQITIKTNFGQIFLPEINTNCSTTYQLNQEITTLYPNIEEYIGEDIVYSNGKSLMLISW